MDSISIKRVIAFGILSQKNVIASKDVWFFETQSKHYIKLPTSAIDDPTNLELSKDTSWNKNKEETLPLMKGTPISSDPPASEIKIISEINQEDDSDSEGSDTEFSGLRRPMRLKTIPPGLDDYVLYSYTTTIYEPNNCEETMNGADRDEWLAAMEKEYQSCITNNTWG